MRHMSFALTTAQMRARTKTVTRRTGWASLKPGTLIQAVEKAQGLRKGEHVRRLGVIRVLVVTREPLSAITDEDVRREGFANMDAFEFVAMFCEHNGGDQHQQVTRIEFEHMVDEQGRDGNVLIDTTTPGNCFAIFCDRCGERLSLLLPVSVDTMTTVTDAFSAAHKTCQ